MQFPQPMLEGKLLARRKRFLADVELPGAGTVLAHCPNPGSMQGNAVPGSRVWLWDIGEDHLQQGKKLRYRWIYVESEGAKVCIDTNYANRFVYEEINADRIPELSGYVEVIPEFTIDDSRLDFLLRSDGTKRDCVVEVKSVSMFAGTVGYFPDSVTVRGQKHLHVLAEQALQGNRAVLFFLVQRSGLKKVAPADKVDPVYGEYLRSAIDLGIEVLCYETEHLAEGFVRLGKRLELDTHVE